MNNPVWIGFLISAVVFTTSCDTSISEYEPKNEDEKQIISLLSTFVDAGNAGDLATIAVSFHDSGTYKSVRGAQITKNQIAETKPEWWTVSGNVRLANPKMTVSKDRAKVVVTAKHGAHYKTTTVFTVVKENQRWLILKVE
jgi:hypothetical protein